MRAKIKRFTILGMLILGSLALSEIDINGQVANVANERSPIRLAKIIKRSGWTIPTVQQLILTGKHEVTVNDNRVFVSSYKPRTEMKSIVQDFFLIDESLIVNSQDVSIREVSIYSVNGNAYAFEIQYSPFTIGKEGVSRIQAAVIKKYYFDLDGDNRFEAMYDSPRIPNILPAWAVSTRR